MCRAEHHTRTRDVFVYRHADFFTKQSAEVGRRPSKSPREGGKRESLIVVILDVREHALQVLVYGGRGWHGSPPVAHQIGQCRFAPADCRPWNRTSTGGGCYHTPIDSVESGKTGIAVRLFLNAAAGDILSN